MLQETQSTNLSRSTARQVRDWVREIRDMAGSGWEGWRWTVAKDACGQFCGNGFRVQLTLRTGFAAFFMIFEVSRQLAARSQTLVLHLPYASRRTERTIANSQRVAYATTLVAGGAVAGLCYEVVGRPFDNARYLARLEQLTPHTPPRTIPQLLIAKLKNDGAVSFLKDPNASQVAPEYAKAWQQRLFTTSRALARVGPWGGRIPCL